MAEQFQPLNGGEVVSLKQAAEKSPLQRGCVGSSPGPRPPISPHIPPVYIIYWQFAINNRKKTPTSGALPSGCIYSI
ncbi:MAG TPA: hypothetical protein IGS52_10695 [Oscillatoriaceae cyanobacterium M33_DOE_052]|uniref:Uncharacterized protein n=1 Tax=Planktothricoides sp. SpSt-374 TaxID=2282167 RepID=A0A7C3VUZ0_9CYAN|nr:hypothetical protein [Oscillatoriaceae cyanobacterium M33_DOE_052]